MNVLITYDEKLQRITKVEQEEAIVSEGLTFVIFLKFIFDSYPEIPKLYPPGSIELRLNDKPPKEFEVLNDGDVISLKVLYSVN